MRPDTIQARIDETMALKFGFLPKPHIYRSTRGGWFCGSASAAVSGYATPKLAYIAWMQEWETLQRSVTPLRGAHA